MPAFNYIDAALAAVVLLAMLAGIFRGFLFSVSGIAVGVTGGILSRLCSPYLALGIYNLILRQKVLELLLRVFPSGSVESTIQEQIDNAMNALPEAVPQAARLFGFYPDAAKLFPDSSAVTVDYLEENMIQGIVIKALTAVCIVLLFTVFSVFLRFLCRIVIRRLTDKEKHRKLRTADKVAGGIFGLVSGVIPSFVIAVILCLVAAGLGSGAFYDEVNASYICGVAAQIIT